MIKVIAGLGNPGLQYEKTRHNAGFIFLDCLADSMLCRWSTHNQFQAELAEFSIGPNKFILLKPMTYMNKSGLSVGKVLRYYKLEPEELLVVHDELDLSEGVIKLKRDGGHAGHNGLRDIIAHIGSRDFYRLRIGIGRPAVGVNVADYVLSSLSKSVLNGLNEVFGLLIDNLGLLLEGDVPRLNAKLGGLKTK